MNCGAYDGGERRAEVRTPSLLAGKLIVADGYISADCTIIDLSAHGARVRVPATVVLPLPLGLLLIDEGVFFDAAIAWRVSNETGLVFNARHDLHTDRSPKRNGVRSVWAELAP